MVLCPSSNLVSWENMGFPANELFVSTIERRFGCPLFLPCGHWPSGLKSTLAADLWMCHVEWCFPTCWFIPGTHDTPAFCWQHRWHDVPLPGFVSVTKFAFRTKERMALHPFTLEATWTARVSQSVSVAPESNRNPRDFTVESKGNRDKDYCFFFWVGPPLEVKKPKLRISSGPTSAICNFRADQRSWRNTAVFILKDLKGNGKTSPHWFEKCGEDDVSY